MKTRSTLLHFRNLAFGIVLACFIALETIAQGVTISRPGNSRDFEFINATWVHQTSSTYAYNSTGWLISLIKTDAITGQNLAKEENTYDQFDNLASTTTFSWQNNAWVIMDGSTNTRTYNTANQVVESVQQMRQNGAMVNIRKDTYTYNPAGDLIEETGFMWLTNTWAAMERKTFTYVNGIRTESQIDLFQPGSGMWQPLSKFLYTGWHVPNEKATSLIKQGKDMNGNWVNFERKTITMGPNGSYEETTELYQNGNWVPDRRANYVFDAQGNQTGTLSERFVNGAWQITFRRQDTFTYNTQNDLTEEIHEVLNSPGVLPNPAKFVYSNFQYFTRLLGTAKEPKAQVTFNLFPNPAQEILNIELSGNALQLQQATITDLTGKTILTQTFKTGNSQQLNLEKVPAGIYLLNLQTAKGTLVKKFVKE